MATAVFASMAATIGHPHSSSSFPQSVSSNEPHIGQAPVSSKRVIPLTRSKRERPCDACRKRKSKCVTADDQQTCTACRLHGQECTFIEDPLPRKRRIDGENREASDLPKRRSISKPALESLPDKSAQKEELQADAKRIETVTHSFVAGARDNAYSFGTYMGPTAAMEPLILGLSPENDRLLRETYQDRAGDPFLLDQMALEKSHAARMKAQRELDQIIGPRGPALLEIYFGKVHSSLPVVGEDVFRSPDTAKKEKLDPILLAAMFAITIPWLKPEHITVKGAPVLDVSALDDLAFSLFTRSLKNPSLITVQAGLLLIQRPKADHKSLNLQLVSVAYDLGLQLDCTNWTLNTAERGLRKRLAWALYVQDKWCSLIHGRPSAIRADDWAVTPLLDEDFAATSENSEESNKTAEKRKELFRQMVSLTQIMSLVLETFYTLKAMEEFKGADKSGTRLILERAKPVQIKLKDWFSGVPSSLKMDADASGDSSSTGFLHLAYFATEITLHRCIIRSLQASNCDAYLLHICRSAAKTRLISAMDFVNRLRPNHLTSIWYFPTGVCFALIGTFGSLLLATAPCQEEVDFYRMRLNEYRWTVAVSSRSAPFLVSVVEHLDTSDKLLKGLPPRPTTAELRAQRGADEEESSLFLRRSSQDFGEGYFRPELLRSGGLGMASAAADSDCATEEESDLVSPSMSIESGSS